MTKLITTKFKKFFGDQIIESITEPANSQMYLFISEHVDRTSSNIATPKDNVRQINIDAYRNMICGKRLANGDVQLMVRNIPWSSKLFTMYDDTANSLQTDDFFCVVDEGSFHHIYKCLDNNMGANSTVEPSFAHITGANTNVYQTSDGYRWKYMTSISSATYDKFATTDFVPVIANTTVVNAAQPGKIEIVRILNGGRNYGNYTNGTFATDEIRVAGDPVTYEISNASSVSIVNGFYTDCMLYLSGGTGSGQYKRIIDYYTNNSGNFVTVNSAFSTPPTNGTTYDINPRVLITGDEQETSVAEGRALINSLSTNSVYRVEMFSSGNNYSYAIANVSANATVGVTTPAEVRPIYSPTGGHGFDVADELGCEHFAISVTLSNTESNTIPETNSFQQFGILRDPLFANVQVEHSGAAGLLVENEIFYKISPIQFATNASINTSSAIVTCDGAKFSNQISAGDKLYLESSNGTSHMLATVNSVTNSSQLVMTVNGFYSCTEVLLHFPNTSAHGVINSITNTTSVLMTNVSGVLSSGDLLIGNTSGATLVINSISRNDVTKGFDTFVQMYKYVGAVTSNSFVQDELVYQGSNSAQLANGRLHSAITDGTTTFYVSNQVGDFALALGLNGLTSKSTATLSAKYEPELVFGSGDIMYLENANSTNRQDSQTFKLIFNL